MEYVLLDAAHDAAAVMELVKTDVVQIVYMIVLELVKVTVMVALMYVVAVLELVKVMYRSL